MLYIAAISGIDPELYEAARVDGAGRFRSIWHITLPGIMPTYFVLLLLTIANFINNGLEQYFVFQNPINKDHIEVLDLYVYNIGLLGSNFSFATAISMLKSIISIILLFFANSLSKVVRGESIV
ncbi:ABC transporter permease subunit [Paenibacillus sp. sptzw28]|uniref:ABC transporter permease subunit n=1 Tax=Paenibacillus sp. sptzw28 TaxID=715179 RepID=UPI0028697B28|nr:ABC transporter permease subunit [Paenibacillus sp. sptzw28]